MDRKLIWRQANALKEQGHRARDAKDWSQAHAAYASALALYVQIDARSLQGCMLAELGYIARKNGQLSEAKDYFKQALALKIASVSINNNLVYALANVCFLHGNQEEACDLIPKMWGGVEKQRNQTGYVWAFSIIGQFAEKIGAYDLANESYRKGLHYDVLLNRGRAQDVGIVCDMGRITRKQGQYIISQAFHAQAMHLCEQSRSLIMKATIFFSWALLEQDAGHLQSACNLIRLACLEEKRHVDDSAYNESMRPEMLEAYVVLTGTPFN